MREKTHIFREFSFYSLIAMYILAPIFEFFRGTRTLRCLKYLEESQWWNEQKLCELQTQKLQKLIFHAYHNVPYYRRIFDEGSLNPSDINDAADLIKLPILNKKTIRDFSHELTASNFQDNKKIMLYTAGSTGEPLRFLSSKNARMNWGFASLERNLHRGGYKLGNKLVMIYGIRPAKSFLENYARIVRNFFRRTLIIDPKNISLQTLPIFARKLQQFKPEYIVCYPSALELLAKFIQQKHEYDIRLRAIISTAEHLHNYQRKLFFDVFQCETFDSYSAWEAPGIASECDRHNGLHISTEVFVVEIVDSEGFPVNNGVEGRILITNLSNYVMPFIRYEIGDMGALSAETCLCGRGLPLLAKLSGRTADIIITPSGKLISGTALIDTVAGITGLTQFQIVQEDYKTITINVVLEEKYADANHSEIKEDIISKHRNILGEDMEIVVRFVDFVESSREGKRRFVLSKIGTQ